MTEEILLRIQKNFPLQPRPFAVIADELGCSEDEVISDIKDQYKKNIIRQTSAIFDTKSLGYKSSLVAFDIDKSDMDGAVDIINSHPGVSHNYERNHDFNVWFTLAVAPDSKLGLEKTVEILAKKTNAKDYIILPTLKLFKISVKLDTTGKESKKEQLKKKEFKKIELDDTHKKIISVLQNDIEITKEPFKKIIEELGIEYELFFQKLDELLQSGVMRRFASILNHRKAGFGANGMVVWNIDEKDAEEIGQKAAAFSAVSHCYLRPKYPNWQYNLFTMIHGKSKEDVESVVDDIAKEIEYEGNMSLYSSKEFKKVRIKYFSNEFEKWEEKED